MNYRYEEKMVYKDIRVDFKDFLSNNLTSVTCVYSRQSSALTGNLEPDPAGLQAGRYDAIKVSFLLLELWHYLQE